MQKTNEIKDPIIIEARYIKESERQILFNCEGNIRWFPKTLINYDKEKKELEAPKWKLQQLFPNEHF